MSSAIPVPGPAKIPPHTGKREPRKALGCKILSINPNKAPGAQPTDPRGAGNDPGSFPGTGSDLRRGLRGLFFIFPPAAAPRLLRGSLFVQPPPPGPLGRSRWGGGPRPSPSTPELGSVRAVSKHQPRGRPGILIEIAARCAQIRPSITPGAPQDPPRLPRGVPGPPPRSPNSRGAP